MNTNCHRRAVLAAIGSVTVVGCTGEDDDSWTPPSFDDTGIERVTDSPVPARPEPIPVSPSDANLDAFESRVETLLAPVPEDLDAELVPNGRIREAILEARETAHAAIDRMRSGQHTLTVADEAIEACSSAATAAGVWRHVSVDHSPTDLPLSSSAVAADARRLQESVPDVAESPGAGVVFYAAIDERAPDRSIGAYDRLEQGADPLETGDAASRLEGDRASIDVLANLHERYLDSLENPEPIAATLDTAIEALAEPTYERFETYYGGEVPDFMRARSFDEYVDTDLPRDHPGREFFMDRMFSYFSDGNLWPQTWQEGPITQPSLTLRKTHTALAQLDAFAAVRSRIEDGDELVPGNATDVEMARTSAIEAVSTLRGSGNPLDVWTAWMLVPNLREADADLPDHDEVREYSNAFGAYVWVATLASAAKRATDRVERAFDN